LWPLPGLTPEVWFALLPHPRRFPIELCMRATIWSPPETPMHCPLLFWDTCAAAVIFAPPFPSCVYVCEQLLLPKCHLWPKFHKRGRSLGGETQYCSPLFLESSQMGFEEGKNTYMCTSFQSVALL
jgi:hypothetical protein